MKQIKLMGISPKSFKEGSENYNVVCEYNKSVCNLAKVKQYLANGVSNDFAENTKAVLNLIQSDFDIETLKENTIKNNNEALYDLSSAYANPFVSGWMFSFEDKDIMTFLKSESKVFGKEEWSDNDVEEAYYDVCKNKQKYLSFIGAKKMPRYKMEYVKVA